MKNEPCAKLMVRVTPKISDSPTDTRNSDDALASPLSNWASRPDALMRQCSSNSGLLCGRCEKATRAPRPGWLFAPVVYCALAGRSFLTSASEGW